MKRLALLVLVASLFLSGCISTQSTWENAYMAAGRLDFEVEPYLAPGYHKVIRKDDLFIHICSPDIIKKICPNGGSQCLYRMPHTIHIYVLGGKLPTGHIYVSTWGLGHEYQHYLQSKIDINPDKLCEGLP